MHLLCYRHKVTWAYQQRCQLVNQLKQGAKKIQSCEQALRRETPSPEQLQTILNQAWQVLSDYTSHLDELNSQRHTIEINTDNYQKRLDQLTNKSNLDLTLLAEFATFVKEKYQPQVIRDYEGFSPKLGRLDNLIQYIRTSVAILEETRDRDLQKNIAIWGIGLAAGAIVASVAGQFPIAELNTETDFWLLKAWFPAGISVALSMGSGLIVSFFVWLVIYLKQR